MRKIFAVLALAAGAAMAQPFEAWFNAGTTVVGNKNLGSDPSVITSTKDSDVQLTSGFRFSLSAVINHAKFQGFEFGYGYNHTHLKFNDQGGAETGFHYNQGFFDYIIYGTPEGSRIRPYGVGGLHFSSYAISGGSTNKFGINYGGGVKFKVGSKFLGRFEVKDFANGKPFDLPHQHGWLQQVAVTVGVGIGI